MTSSLHNNYYSVNICIGMCTCTCICTCTYCMETLHGVWMHIYLFKITDKFCTFSIHVGCLYDKPQTEATTRCTVH